MTFYKWSKTAATNANADSTINWQEGQAPSSVNDSSRAEMAANAKWRDDISGTLTTTGSSTAFALTTNQSFSTAALMSGALITFIPHTNSGASPTLAVDGLTARAINKSTGVAVATGALIAGTPYCVTYVHASTEFVVQSYTETFGSLTSTGTLAVTGAATLSSTLAVTGNVSVNTNKFNITAASGNTAIAGDLAIATNKFTVAAASGNTVIAGTLNVTGTITGSAAAVTVQRLLSGTAQTFTPTAGAVRWRVRMCGPAGGGGAQSTNAGANGSADTSFQVNSTGTAWTAVKGSGGPSASSNASGGAGGTGGTDGSTGTKIDRIDGARGGPSQGGGSAAPGPGYGGPSAMYGVAGPASVTGATGQAGPTNSGGGGAGGGTVASGWAGGGGGGEFVSFWVTGMTTATYTVGLGGAGGTAGTVAGGAGAAGIIIIEEFYS